ncbi:hypothetical protein BTR23_13575 [Alkalihalophilus pseudofirmus]|nr:hypothetical protein BTR23_13575 [Alkalihalophilus pseudofirmus]
MLVAHTNDKKRINLVKGWNKEQLEKLRKNFRFVCPVCKKSVRLKLGSKRRWHFAHYGEVSCNLELEAESDYHLLGKEQLYHWFISQNIHALLEPYLTSINQRPDILIHYQKRYYAIEYQCSPIPLSLFEKRTRSYLEKDILPIWIFGGNRLTRKSSILFSLSPIEWAALQPHVQLDNFLLYYCSTTQQFFSLLNVSSLSSQSALSQIKITRLQDCSFASLLGNVDVYDDNWKLYWITIKKKWRYSVTPYPSRTQQYFNDYCLQRKISPWLYPIEAGWPTKHHQWFETSPHIWQTFILIYLLNFPLEYKFTFQDVYRYLKELVKTNICRIRSLPYYEGHFSYAIMSYLQLLLHSGFIKRNKTKEFFRVKEIKYPQSIEEAIKRDEEFVKNVKIN